MSIRTDAKRPAAPPSRPSGGRIDLGSWAAEHMKKARVITELRAGRGQPDLLGQPGALAKLKVGSFEKPTRGGALTFNVYSVPLPGKDDKLVNHVIVDAPYVKANDAIGHRFYDLGPGPDTRPNV